MLHGFLHRPIFQGVEGDYTEHTARGQQARNLFNGLFQAGKFGIDFDSNRLEAAFGGMGSPPARAGRNRVIDNVHQLAGGLNGFLLPLLDNELRNSGSPLFFTVTIEDVRQFSLAVFVNHLACGQRLRLIHTHIQRSIRLIRKAAFGTIQLPGRNAQIQQDAIERPKSRLPKQFGRVFVVPMECDQAVTETGKPFARGRQCLFIAVNTN